MSHTSSRLASWLGGKSIGQRLNIQARAAVILCVAMVVTSTGGSLVSLGIMKKDNEMAHGALTAALLEKDFASLERDVFQNALLQDSEARTAMEANAEDLKHSIAAARKDIGGEYAVQLDSVAGNSNAYVEVVRNIIAQGAVDRNSVAQIMEAGDKVDGGIEGVRSPMVVKSEALDEQQSTLTYAVMGITLLIVCITGLVSVVLARRIKAIIGTELHGINDSITNIAVGNLSVDIPHSHRQDELGDLARAAVKLRETSIAKQQADQGMREMVKVVGDALRRLADGDLTTQLPKLADGYEALQKDFNQTMRQLHEAMLSVASAANGIGAGSREISQASDDLARRTENHATNLAEAAETISQITGSVGEAAEGAAQTNALVNVAVSEAKQSGSIVRKAVDAMGNIEQATQEIGKIIGVIDGITFQTNLLALNAGVEAARAGDAGKGFAVVASEVRALAQRSADAARDINELITSSTQEVAVGVELVADAGKALERIAAKINEITGLVGQISVSAEQQSIRLTQTNGVMANMDRVTQQNAAMVEQSTAAARSLAEEARRLTSLVHRFHLGDEDRLRAAA